MAWQVVHIAKMAVIILWFKRSKCSNHVKLYNLMSLAKDLIRNDVSRIARNKYTDWVFYVWINFQTKLQKEVQ